MNSPDTLQDLKDSRDIWAAKAESWRVTGETWKREGKPDHMVQMAHDEFARRKRKASELNRQIQAMEAGHE
jgi:hypothetical protein